MLVELDHFWTSSPSLDYGGFLDRWSEDLELSSYHIPVDNRPLKLSKYGFYVYMIEEFKTFHGRDLTNKHHTGKDVENH